jgi:ketosteroid isomerase-like protein
VVALIGLVAPLSVLAAERSPADTLRRTEAAFAATMQSRDLDAFASFLDDEVIFFNGPEELRGKQAVIDAWSAYFSGDDAPFAWRPEVVSVLDSGSLGLTSGPVEDADGKIIASFNSIWRKDAAGEWKIIFDRGCR